MSTESTTLAPSPWNLPNALTVMRILLVPVVVWAIATGQIRLAFILFLCAGISDGVDGFLAKRFG